MNDLRMSPQAQKLFRFATVTCIAFLALTTAAMLLYPGGTIENHAEKHYAFFGNPFSDLGRTHVFDGRSNAVSMTLFMTAMLGSGSGLAAFFVAFASMSSKNKKARFVSVTAAIFGIGAGICFIGVAATPWDHFMHMHILFVLFAFRSFLAATMLDLLAVLISGRNHRLIWPFAIFIIILTAYLVVLTTGLNGGPLGAMAIQAAAQKIVVYAAIVMVLVQSVQLNHLNKFVAF